MLAELVITESGDGTPHTFYINKTFSNFFAYKNIEDIGEYAGKYAVIKEAYTLDDNYILFEKSNVQTFTEQFSDLFTLIKDDNDEWYLETGIYSINVCNPSGKTCINAATKLTPVHTVVVFDLADDGDGGYEFQILNMFPIEGTGVSGPALSSLDLFTLENNPGLTIVDGVPYIGGDYEYEIIEIGGVTYTVTKFDFAGTSYKYTDDATTNQLSFTSPDVIPVGAEFIYDNVMWIIVSAKLLNNDNAIQYTCSSKTVFDSIHTYGTFDSLSDLGTNTTSNILTDGDNMPLPVEAPGYHLLDIEKYVLANVHDTEYKMNGLTSDDIVYSVTDVIGADDLKFVEYDDLQNFNLSGFDITNYSFVDAITKNRVILQNKFKKRLYPFDLSGNVNNVYLNDVGFSLFAADGVDSSNKPVSRFTNFYKPAILYTDIKSNIISYDENKTRLVDGTYKAITAAVNQNNSDMLNPLNTAKLASAQPFIPESGLYFDSVLPTLVSWETAMMKLNCVNNQTGDPTLVPTAEDITMYNELDSDVMNTFLWTRSNVSYDAMSEVSDAQVTSNLVHVSDDGKRVFTLEDSITPLSLIQMNKLQPLKPILNSTVKSLYKTNQDLPPFCCNLSNGRFNGLFYNIKFINKQVLSSAQQGMCLKLTSTRYAVVLDFNKTGSDFCKLYLRDNDTGLYSDKAYTTVNGDITDYLINSSVQENDSDMCAILLDRIRVSEINAKGETVDVSLGTTNVDRLIIVPPRHKRTELNAFVKLSLYNAYFTTYNFGSKPFMLIPYATIYDSVTDENKKYTVVSATTYDKLRKVSEPQVKHTYTIQRSVKIDATKNNITSQFGITEFPCKISINGKTLFANELNVSVNGSLATMTITADDRNDYLESAVFDDVKTDKNIDICDFVYRRRLMSFAQPSEYVYVPPMAIDTWLENEISDIISENIDYYGYLTPNIIVEGTMKYPDGMTCTLSGVYTDPNKGFLVSFDLSGFKLDDGTKMLSSYFPFSMKIAKTNYYGLSFKPYTIATSQDANHSITCDIDNPDDCASFVYPSITTNPITVDISTYCVTGFSVKQVAYPRFGDDIIDTSTEEGLNTYKQLITKIGGSYRVSTIDADVCGTDVDYKVATFDLRPDNPVFKVVSRRQMMVWKHNAANETYTDKKDLTGTDAATVYDGLKKDFKVKITSNCAGEWKEVDSAYNASEVRINVESDDNEDSDNRFMFYIGLPPTEVVASGTDIETVTILPGVDRTDLCRFLYIAASKTCQLHVGATPAGMFNDTVPVSNLDSYETYNLLPGECRVIPLCTFANGVCDFDIGSVFLSNVQEDTEISIYGIQYYSQFGTVFKTESELVINNDSK
ncbi:hypothetical protein HNP86_001934 [Methanococcus maripaludis]|uniref:Uncharacterized protein n=1 Tax=Methanococcus maripaludis TaxID=39152 RepID=A0A7J9NWZ9_METMI|nr:hypothetical protein [Methanococcus maripaludis]MBA2851775.1 hypothetical protein [Methanococcus maripaludis]